MIWILCLCGLCVRYVCVYCLCVLCVCIVCVLCVFSKNSLFFENLVKSGYLVLGALPGTKNALHGCQKMGV